MNKESAYGQKRPNAAKKIKNNGKKAYLVDRNTQMLQKIKWDICVKNRAADRSPRMLQKNQIVPSEPGIIFW